MTRRMLFLCHGNFAASVLAGSTAPIADLG